MIDLYKLDSSTSLKKFPHCITVEGITYTNEASEPYALAAGWKELTVDEKPTYDEQTQYLTYEYEETEEVIIQHWIINELAEDVST